MALQAGRVHIPKRADVSSVSRALFTGYIRVRPRSVCVSDNNIVDVSSINLSFI